jgi:hypothetical protein
MKKLLLPIIMLLVGTGGGVGAGLFLAPPAADTAKDDGHGDESKDAHADDAHAEDDHSETAKDDHSDDSHSDDGHGDDSHGDASGNDYAKLNNQFVVPIVSEGSVNALVLMSLTLEVPEGGIEAAYSIEPRLRDRFLQVMFDHANVGGFSGNFTNASNMKILRDELRRSAVEAAGDVVIDVLILDIVRQDV